MLQQRDQANTKTVSRPRNPRIPEIRRAGEEGGWVSLTPAEWRVLPLLAEGLFYREIAERLHVSRRTVESHVASMFLKLGVRSKRDLQRAYLGRQTTASHPAFESCPTCGRVA